MNKEKIKEYRERFNAKHKDYKKTWYAKNKDYWEQLYYGGPKPDKKKKKEIIKRVQTKIFNKVFSEMGYKF